MGADAGHVAREFYTTGGPFSDPGDAAGLLDGLPATVGELVGVVQGLMLHVYWAERYGVALDAERRGETALRSVPRLLARVTELDRLPLTEARPVDRRVIGTCRDFTVLLCALLRHQGVPARARCGFGTYFMPEQYEDHWVAEVWQRDRWVMVDAQLDEVQREVLGVTFDPLDVPNDLFADPGAVAGDSLPPEGSLLPVETQQFLVAGRAWQLCRSGAVDPQRFGIFDSRGEEFVAGNVVRDALALNSVEILPWDMWGAMPVPGGDRADAMDRPFLDRLAELAISADATWAELRELYAAEPRLHTRPRWVTDPEPFHARHPADWS